MSIVASSFFSELFCSQVAFSSQCLSRLVCTVVLLSWPSLFCILTFLTIACDVVFSSSEDNCLFSYCKLLVYLCLTCVPRLTSRGTSVFWQARLVFMRLCSCCGHPVLWSWKACWPVGPFPSTRHMVFKRIVVQTGAVTAAGAGTGDLSERFDTLSHSPLSLALVSKQYSSLNCSLAYACCHTCAS